MATPSKKKSGYLLDSTEGAANDDRDSYAATTDELRFPEFSLEDALEDTPEVRDILKVACASTEAIGSVVKSVLKKAASLKESLKRVERERSELLGCLRQLEPIFDPEHSSHGRFKGVCDSMEEVNRLLQGEAELLQSLLCDPFSSLVDQSAAVRRDYKSLLRLRNTSESLADKVSAAERRASDQSEELQQQFRDSRCQYRHALISYGVTMVSGQRERRALVLRQLHELWIARHGHWRSVETTMANVAPQMSASMGTLEQMQQQQRVWYAAQMERTKQLENGDLFPGHLVCGTATGKKEVALSGYLWRRGSGKLGTWSRRFFRVRGGCLRSENDICVSLVTSRVKACTESDRRNCFVVIGPSEELLLQAPSMQDMEVWVRVLEQETVRLLNDNSMSKSSTARGEQRAGGSGPLEDLKVADVYNAMCADCTMGNPEWAAINLGILFCINCSGVHRSLGVQYSKVRSFRLDSWSDAELAVMHALGNERVSRSLLESRPEACSAQKPLPDATQAQREAFIIAKYVRKEMMTPLVYDASLSREHHLVDAVDQSADQCRLTNVLHALLAGADCNWKDPRRSNASALLCAVRQSHLAAVELLLLHGSDVNACDDEGCTALHAAARTGNIEITGVLLKRGANLDARLKTSQQRPVEVAAAAENADCVTLLRLVQLSLMEKNADTAKDSLSFSNVLDDFTKNLKQKSRTSLMQKQ